MKLSKWVATHDIDKQAMATVLGVGLSTFYKWTKKERVPHLEAAIRIVELTKGEVGFRDLLIVALPPLPALVPSQMAIRAMRKIAKAQGDPLLGHGLRSKRVEYDDEDDL